MKRRNWGRGLLVVETLLFGSAGFWLWTQPELACQFMGESRGILESLVRCPSYAGEHPVFEMYSFSLAKHIAMLNIAFAYFAIFGRSKEGINAGFIYLAFANALDCVPIVTWFASSEALSPGTWPPMFRIGALSVILAAVGVPLNSRHAEWRDAGEATS